VGRPLIQACARDGCDNDAKFYPLFLLPPKGARKNYPDKDKIQVPMRLPICRPCSEALDPHEFFITPEQRAIILRPMKAMKKTMPDFKKMTVTFIPIDEGEAFFTKTHGR
jgi:hypothetical protein